MRIDINLLPEKPKKNYLLITIFGISYGVLMVLLLFGVFYYQSLQREYVQVEQKIDTTVKLQQIVSEQQPEQTTYPRLDRYVYSIEENLVSPTEVLDQLVGELPTGATFVNYDYNIGGSISLSVTFAEKRETSSYLHHLNNLPLVSNVTLNSVNVQSEDDVENYAASFTIQLNMDVAKQITQGVVLTEGEGAE
ncbi:MULTISPECIES: PilN domain-containing protein [Bacillaceae]|uniref:Uncharacterized protein n=1 Tax=Evansella alkalicola TaxID=745819 RepID=A0ABS6JTL2_9BACI|nr:MULTISPECIES: hypothetical protein [Bacillaceae]MBU9721910.1 hypothetical protein [Bacillus alkalicola]